MSADALIARIIAAYNNRDLDALVDCFTDDTVFDGTEFAEGIYRGKDAYRKFIEGFLQVADYRYSSDYRVGEVGNRVVGVFEALGSGVGSGLPIEGTFIFSYVLRGDLVAEQKYHRNLETVPEDLREALGEASAEGS